MSPARAKSRSSRLMRRFSRSFQHDTPTKRQMKPTELLPKFQELSLPSVSVNEFLTSRRHLTSSSAEEGKSRGSSSSERRGQRRFIGGDGGGR